MADVIFKPGDLVFLRPGTCIKRLHNDNDYSTVTFNMCTVPAIIIGRGYMLRETDDDIDLTYTVLTMHNSLYRVAGYGLMAPDTAEDSLNVIRKTFLPRNWQTSSCTPAVVTVASKSTPDDVA